MKKVFLILLLMGLSGCAYKNPLSDMKFQTTMTQSFVIANWYKIEEPGLPIKIYIEGDANNTEEQNPTPTDSFMRQLAANDPSPNVAYLARPCQYLQVSCSKTDWTTGRFSEKVILSLDQSVSELMKKSKSKQAILIGFSGGAQIAGLIAVRHPDRVKKVITISGILDHQSWTKFHHLPPLNESLNLAENKKLFNQIPQVHYVGEKDTVVPVSLARQWTTNGKIILVPKAEYGKNYDSVYNQIYGER